MSHAASMMNFGSVPVTTAILRDSLTGYKAPQARIRLMERREELLPLRRNLYIYNDGSEYSRQLIANHILSPSYVSFESALWYKGIIPERVHTVRSACLVRSRSFTNATGQYDYIQVASEYYPIGVKVWRTAQGYGYMMACAEKALCDLILATPGLRLQSSRAVGEYLESYLRANMEYVASWNADLLHAIASAAHKKKKDLFNLEKFVRNECV